ncbi:hypothetical protein HDV00_006389 [Rhizophlyctis rosea]|nr:hypothetical protein HDV00_006389 [Rhizophlyctis rosea]
MERQAVIYNARGGAQPSDDWEREWEAAGQLLAEEQMEDVTDEGFEIQGWEGEREIERKLKERRLHRLQFREDTFIGVG